MKKILVLVFSFSVHFAFSQKIPAFDASQLKIRWELLESGYKKSPEMLSQFTLTNTGSQNLPDKGWTIYFNAAIPRNADGDSTLLKTVMVNGDLVKLYPERSFHGLAPNTSVKVKLLSRELKNITDYQKGFYIVFDNEPSKGIKLDFETVSAIDYTKKDKQSAEKLYLQNAVATDVPEDKLSPVFPTPVSYTRTSGVFSLGTQVKIKTDKAFSREAAYLAGELKKLTGVRPGLIRSAGKNRIILHKKP
ncbi:MAG TPA: carbohydate-binding domain-containing protein, partial [Pedobacter sp.]